MKLIFTTEDTSPTKSDDYVCPTCEYRNLTLKSETCHKCIFLKNHPNYKKDIRLTNMKLDEFPELTELIKSCKLKEG